MSQDANELLARSPFLAKEKNKRDKTSLDRLKPFLDTVKIYWKMLVLAGLVGLAAGIFYLNYATKIYSAEMIIGPVSNDGTSPLSMLSSSSLTALARNPLGLAADATPFDKFRQLVYSNDTGAVLMTQPLIMKRVYGPLWDPVTGGSRPTGTEFEAIEFLRTVLARPGWTPPDASALKNYVSKNITLTKLDTNGLYLMSSKATSPEFARTLLLDVYRTTDNLLKARELEKTKKYIGYLVNELNNDNTASQRQVLIDLLSRQEQTLMVSSVNVPYAAVILDNPQLPGRPISPKVFAGILLFPFLFILGTLMGLHFLPVGLWRRENASSTYAISDEPRRG